MGSLMVGYNLMRVVMLVRRLNDRFIKGNMIPSIMFSCLRFFWNIDEQLPTIEEAESYLDSICSDPRNSSICSNQLCKEQGLDLQIIVPIYNVEKYVVKCIKSILNQQTQYKFRVILINDGSTDRSLELIKSYGDDPRVTIISQKNKGFSGARNAGLEKIYANYVTFVDSDDELAPGAIEHLMSAAYGDKSDIVQGGYRTKKVNGEFKGKIQFEDKVSSTSEYMSGYPWGKVYRAELFKNIHFPEGYWYEDTINGLLLFLRASRFSCIKDNVYYYLINNAGISSTSKGKPKSLDSFYVMRSLMCDELRLGILNELDASRFIRQIKITYSRTFLLGEQVRKAIFVLTIILYNMWKEQKLISGSFTGMDSLLFRSFEMKDFKLYERCCICF